MPKLTLKRAHAKDPIHVSVLVLDPATEKGALTTGLFDTGNDHAAISKELFDSLGITATGRQLSVTGVTGASMGQTACVTLGIEFDGGQKIEIEGHEVVVIVGASNPVLIGRDFLDWFDVTIARDGLFTLER